MHQRNLRFIITVALGAFLIAVGLASCSDDNSENPTQTGTLQMVLVDAPAALPAIDSLKVVFSEVRVHRSSGADLSDGGWYVVLADTLPPEARTFDLLRLVDGVFATLGDVELGVGRYTQVRIMLESATLYVDGVPQTLTIPSGYQTGIKLVGGFNIEPGITTVVAADFDVTRSLHETPPGSGNYMLRPTIRLVQMDLTGTISGTVTPTGIGAVLFALAPASGDTVTTTPADPVTGTYLLPGLPPGTYNVRAEAAGYADSTRTGIAVTVGANTSGVNFELVPASE